MDLKIKEKILDAAIGRMLRVGFRKVTMDEIARDLSMSKNTIYKHFAGKDEIAEALFRRLEAEIDHELSLIEESNAAPLDVITKCIFFLHQKLNPWFENLLGDIKTDLPDLWRRFINFRNEKIAEIKTLVEQGIKQGKFRKTNSALAVRMYMGAIDHVLNPEFLQSERISFADALEGVMDIWSAGIKTKK